MAPTEATGIVQADVLIRGAVIAAINDLRVNTYLLDYVFASLAQDNLTSKEYGTSEIAKAKDWFIHQDIRTYLNVNMSNVQFPCISIALANSIEDDTTFGDVHYEPTEDTDLDWPTLAGPATPISYDTATGTAIFDEDALDGLVLAPGMLLVDKTGRQFPILEVPDYTTTLVIAPNTVVDLTGAVIKPARPSSVTEIESAVYKETYSLGCHTDSEPLHVTYLHSIVVFALLRYKESLLEGRGYERSSLNSSDLRRDDETLPESIYSRYISISGYIRQAWPKITAPKITSTQVSFDASNLDDTQLANFTQQDATTGAALAAQLGSLQTTYTGAADQPVTIDAAFIKGLSSATRTNTRQATLRFIAGTTQYCWYALPVSLAKSVTTEDFIDTETADIAGFSLMATILIDNSYYQIWRTNQAGLGPLTVLVT